MKDILIKEYNNTTQLGISPKEPRNNFFLHFVQSAFFEITGNFDREYLVKFINQDNDELIWQTSVTNNMWTKVPREYFINYKVQAFNKSTGELEFEHKYNAEGKRVFLCLDSGALGDTLAWFPYIEEFRKKHKCHVICSTHHNDWFKTKYPEIEFVKPGTRVNDLYAMYCIGWYYDEDKKYVETKHPREFKDIPLQQTATDILGLSFTEVKPILNFKDRGKQIKDKYVVIAPHASAHAKYWMYPKGWQTIIDYLNDKGYKVVMITQEPLGDKWHDSKLGGTLKNVIDKTGDFPLENRMVDIKHADLFIGVGSGMSWLSWALNTPTILISGFSEPYTEFQDCERIFNADPNICRGCFNTHWLNPGDWEWCPEHKNTPRHFECTKTIKPEQVIVSIDKVLNIYQ